MVFTRRAMGEHLGHGVCGRLHDGTAQEAVHEIHTTMVHRMGHAMLHPWYVLWGSQRCRVSVPQSDTWGIP